MLFAHAGHWLTTIAYFVPVVAFLAWLVVTQVRERRGRVVDEAGSPPDERYPRRSRTRA
jgi:hypothetical protein